VKVRGAWSYNQDVVHSFESALGGEYGCHQWMLSQMRVPFPATVNAEGVSTVGHERGITANVETTKVLLFVQQGSLPPKLDNDVKDLITTTQLEITDGNLPSCSSCTASCRMEKYRQAQGNSSTSRSTAPMATTM